MFNIMLFCKDKEGFFNRKSQWYEIKKGPMRVWILMKIILLTIFENLSKYTPSPPQNTNPPTTKSQKALMKCTSKRDISYLFAQNE